MNILWKVVFDIAVNKTLATEHTLKLFLTVQTTRHLLTKILWQVIFDIAVNKTLATEHTLKSYFWHYCQQHTGYQTYSEKLFLTVRTTKHLLMNILWKVIFDNAVNKTLANEHTLKSYFWDVCQQDTCYRTYSEKLFLTVLSTTRLLMNVLWQVIFETAVNKTLATERTLASYFWQCCQQDAC